MPDKTEIMNYFARCAEQAAFDGDGNAEAMFVGLKNDVQTVMPESAFIVRPTFIDGSEQEARRQANMTAEQAALEKTNAENAARAQRQLEDEAEAARQAAQQSATGGTGPDPVPPAEPVASVPPADANANFAGNAPGTGDAPADPALSPPRSDDPAHDAPAASESETDKKQDAQIAELKEKVEQLEAEKMAAKLAPSQN